LNPTFQKDSFNTLSKSSFSLGKEIERARWDLNLDSQAMLSESIATASFYAATFFFLRVTLLYQSPEYLVILLNFGKF
jgi:hypothetical protein